MSYNLKVNREQLQGHFKALVRGLKTRFIKGIELSFKDGCLTINAGKYACGMAAKGEWDGTVIVARKSYFIKAVNNLPTVPDVHIIAKDDTIWVAETSMRCTCTPRS